MNAIVLVVLAAMAAGCAPSYTEPVVAPPQLTGEQQAFEDVWQATLTTLRRYEFELDRQDRRAGTITTAPLVGKHITEFWRKDAATRTDALESTLQTIYRIVRVEIRPTAPKAGAFAPQVQVSVYRSNRERQRVGSANDILYGRRRPGRAGYVEAKPESHESAAPTATGEPVTAGIPAHFTPLGRDEKLEAKILAAILAKTGTP
jgi:hypothetical protein